MWIQNHGLFERTWLGPRTWIRPSLLGCAILMAALGALGALGGPVMAGTRAGLPLGLFIGLASPWVYRGSVSREFERTLAQALRGALP